MDWMSRRRIGLAAGLAAALAGFVAVCSFAPQDPTFTNLRYPKDGIANWLGYPGALTGGSLVEAFGWAALLLPAAIAYWTLYPVGRPRGWRYAAQTAALLLLAASWAGQWAPEPGLGLASAGLVGWSGGNWVHATLGPWPGFLLLTAGVALGLWHQLYAPGLRSALKDVRAAGRLFTRAGAADARAWLMARLAAAGNARRNIVAVVVLAPVQVVGAVLLGAGHLAARWVVAPLGAGIRGLAGRVRGGAASLRNIKSRTVAPPLPRRRARADAETRREGSDFDGWLLDEEPRAHAAASQPIERHDAAGRAASPPGSSRDEFDRPWEHPAEIPLDDAQLLPPKPLSPPTGAERMADALHSARETLGGETGAPRGRGMRGRPAGQGFTAESVQPELPPAGSGRERWEQLLRRYRENLDLDWDEHGWRAKEPGAQEEGHAKPRGSK
jgi:hypothetical protein